jgi:SAM-dependent methyltransferase/uncharacterized protein YbaR (Trm112 family)
MPAKRAIRFKCPEVEEAANLILERFAYSNAYVFPMRFALTIGQRVCFAEVPLTPPSMDIGVNDGSTACIVHHGKPHFTWGGDMPEESTYESMGLFVTPEFNVYENLLGLDVSSAVPFADNSFNTICATEVFSYGLDRDRTLSELCRVLAPGGTLAFSESAGDILNFPALMEGLKQFVPSLHVLEDGPAYYRRRLDELGLTDVRCRLFFDRPLAGLLHSLMYAANPAADHDYHRRLLVEDQRLRAYYTDGLLALASAMDEEFSRPEGPAGGWHIFVSCRKPGQTRADLAVPRPRCPACHSPQLDTSLLNCQCRGCGRAYKTRYGVPYLLRDENTAYSPKATPPIDRSGEVPADRHINEVLRASYRRLHEAVARPAVRLFGIDPATAFTIRHLKQGGIQILGVVTTTERWAGLRVEGVLIQALPEVARSPEPLLLSGHPGLETSAIAALRAVGFTGIVYSLIDGSAEHGWQPVRIEQPIEIGTPAHQTDAADNVLRRVARKFWWR